MSEEQLNVLTELDGSAVNIIYKGTVLESNKGGKTTTIYCKGRLMEDDIVIHVPKNIMSAKDYITISSLEQFYIDSDGKHWDGTIEISLDRVNWYVVDKLYGEVKPNAITGTATLYIRGTGNTYLTGINEKFDIFDESDFEIHPWYLEGNNISISGNIESLIDYKTVEEGNHPEVGDSCFLGLFAGSVGLTDASKLILSNNVSHSCYLYAFYCESLVLPPQLPATTLQPWCYALMFQSSKIKVAPSLPATELAEYCYLGMFSGCSELETLVALPVEELKQDCYTGMFIMCPKIKLSEIQTEEFNTPYSIPMPTSNSGFYFDNLLCDPSFEVTMFQETGGTFTGTPQYNQIYYTSNTIVFN